jgi:hypothetical protein
MEGSSTTMRRGKGENKTPNEKTPKKPGVFWSQKSGEDVGPWPHRHSSRQNRRMQMGKKGFYYYSTLAALVEGCPRLNTPVCLYCTHTVRKSSELVHTPPQLLGAGMRLRGPVGALHSMAVLAGVTGGKGGKGKGSAERLVLYSQQPSCQGHESAGRGH